MPCAVLLYRHSNRHLTGHVGRIVNRRFLPPLLREAVLNLKVFDQLRAEHLRPVGQRASVHGSNSSSGLQPPPALQRRHCWILALNAGALKGARLECVVSREPAKVAHNRLQRCKDSCLLVSCSCTTKLKAHAYIIVFHALYLLSMRGMTALCHRSWRTTESDIVFRASVSVLYYLSLCSYGSRLNALLSSSGTNASIFSMAIATRRCILL